MYQSNLAHDARNAVYNIANSMNGLSSFFLELFGGVLFLAGHHISGGADSSGNSCAGEDGGKVHCHNNHSSLKFAPEMKRSIGSIMPLQKEPKRGRCFLLTKNAACLICRSSARYEVVSMGIGIEGMFKKSLRLNDDFRKRKYGILKAKDPYRRSDSV